MKCLECNKETKNKKFCQGKSIMNYGYHEEVDKDDPRQEVWEKQREKDGFDETELWNLDITIARFILPRLKSFKEYTHLEIDFPIDEIIHGMEETIKGYDFGNGDREVADKGWRLLGEFYYKLWD